MSILGVLVHPGSKVVPHYLCQLRTCISNSSYVGSKPVMGTRIRTSEAVNSSRGANGVGSEGLRTTKGQAS